MNFTEANKVVHPVEGEWHYPIMVAGGCEAITKEGVGLVRSYKYKHIDTGNIFDVATGVSADYWVDHTANARGYWSDLEPHLKKLNQK